MKIREKIKIVFMGGDLIGCSVLRHILRQRNTKVVLTVGCYHDNGAVIEPKEWNASLTRVALNKSLNYLQPKSPRNQQFIDDLMRLDRPDLIITAGYDQILDSEILKIPRIGTINIHFSPLPKNRGYIPFVWSILSDQVAGVTLHWVNEHINGGDIIAQQSIPIGNSDTSYSIYMKLSKLGINLFKKFFPKILEGKAPRRQQNESAATYHAAGYPYQRYINWNESSEQIDRVIRALTFPGFDGARTFQQVDICILHPVEIVAPLDCDGYPAGTIVSFDDAGIVVKTGDGGLLIKKIKFPSTELAYSANKLRSLFGLDVGDNFQSFENLSKEGKLSLII